MVNAFILAAALSAVPAAANNIISAEQPPIEPRGWTLQFDNRAIYSRSTTFVNRDGTEATLSQASRQFLAIARLYTKSMVLRVSLPVASQSSGGSGRYGVGDAVFEGGALYNPGPWRFRFTAFAKAPTGGFDKTQAVNIGGGQWDLGPILYATRYFDGKRVDVNLYAQYSVRLPNTDNGIRPGGEFSYALAAARAVELGLPMRLGVEQRAFLGEPNRRDGAAVGGARRSLSVGPVAMINMSRFLKGFTLWPTALFDVYNRNTAKTQLYYLKLQFHY